mgnify:CR=1 FL=1
MLVFLFSHKTCRQNLQEHYLVTKQMYLIWFGGSTNAARAKADLDLFLSVSVIVTHFAS